jgi:hypothetical protein
MPSIDKVALAPDICVFLAGDALWPSRIVHISTHLRMYSPESCWCTWRERDGFARRVSRVGNADEIKRWARVLQLESVDRLTYLSFTWRFRLHIQGAHTTHSFALIPSTKSAVRALNFLYILMHPAELWMRFQTRCDSLGLVGVRMGKELTDYVQRFKKYVCVLWLME